MTAANVVETQLLALSPLDGRYAGKVDALRPIFSEYGLIQARVKVEVEWLLALAQEPGIVELTPFSPAAVARLRALADELSVRDAARVKEIERTTNHDVKAVEYLIKEKLKDDAELAPALEFVHFACTSEDINNLSYSLMLNTARGQVMLPALDGVVEKLQAGAKVATAIVRLELGNLSNVKWIGGGLGEYRIDWGPGYRLYFTRRGNTVIVLLFSTNHLAALALVLLMAEKTD